MLQIPPDTSLHAIKTKPKKNLKKRQLIVYVGSETGNN